MNEIGVVQKYIKRLKKIQSGVIEKSEEESSPKFEERVETAIEPARGLKTKAEKKQTQQPLRVISLFVGGLALVIIIGSYFYYQFGQKETQPTKTMGKEQARSESYRVYQEPVTLDQTVKTQTTELETQKISKAGAKESVPVITQKNEAMLADSKPPDLVESKRSMEKQPDGGKEDTVSEDDVIPAETDQQMSSPLSEKVLPATDDVSVKPEKQIPVDLQAKAAPETDGPREAVEKPLATEALPGASNEDALSSTPSEAVTHRASDAEVKKPSTDLETEKKQIVSIESMGKQEDQLSRLKSFLNLYCQTYSNKDLDKFITFFTSDATENNRPFQELVPEYRKNMENTASFTYTIEITSYTKQVGKENIEMHGKFFTRYQLQGGGWEDNSGSISMELLETGDSFLVRRLSY
jgi:hypothetical protein